MFRANRKSQGRGEMLRKEGDLWSLGGRKGGEAEVVWASRGLNFTMAKLPVFLPKPQVRLMPTEAQEPLNSSALLPAPPLSLFDWNLSLGSYCPPASQFFRCIHNTVLVTVLLRVTTWLANKIPT